VASNERTIHVHYYAILREQAGRSQQTLSTTAGTPAELYAELRQQLGLRIAAEHLKVAINSEFGAWDAPLASGDTVVFIPPVAGG